MPVSKNLLLPFLCTFFYTTAVAQAPADTTPVIKLEEVVVKAYEQNKRLKELPAAINYIGRQQLERFAPLSIVQAVNTTPGVRMEERSPGSYRFNIRGSALRSPFGVRNVKVYYNDLPYTNPGGHTYLNQLGYYNFGSLEIIKGPGSSLYGAGTGGVLLIEGMDEVEKPGLFAEYAASSFNGHSAYGAAITGNDKWRSKTSFQHQQNEGYRRHSALRRDVLSWTGNFKLGDQKLLKTTFVYGDLFYETPGALTLTEYNADPKAARPGNAFFLGAETAQAAIYQKTFLAGASYSQQILPKLWSKTVFYGSYTQLKNPTVQNYGRSSEPHFGGRSVFTFKQAGSRSILTANAGVEWQQGFTNVSIHKNVRGTADSIRTYDELANRQSIVFAQLSLDIKTCTLMAGASYNILRLKFQRFIPRPLQEQSRTFNNQIAPRVSLLKKFDKIILYTSVAKGFSPPTTEELLPTGGDINLDLSAEEGVNYDLGFRASLWKGLSLDVNAFHFALDNSIVTRRTAGGGNFYINSGKTVQKGIESSLTYPLLQNTSFVDRSTFWLSHTFHHFRYGTFIKDTNNFSGKKLPGVSPHTVATGFDFLSTAGLLGTVHYLYAAKTPLTDANTEYASSYHVLGAKVGYQKWFKDKWRIKIFAGVDNILNERYSLGNDINGFGGRYYNAAAGRSYYAAIVLQWLNKREN